MQFNNAAIKHSKKLRAFELPDSLAMFPVFFLLLVLVSFSLGCVKPRQTTAVGSGVGGVIGAGLGAIIGNQSGNAGSGVAIGAGAGAAVGALVGNALQAQEERNASQDEALKRQERMIQAQRNEINELRTVKGDDSFAYGAPSSARYRYRESARVTESPEVLRQRAKLQQRGPNPKGSSSTIHSKSYYAYARPEPVLTPRGLTSPGVVKTDPLPVAKVVSPKPVAATLPAGDLVERSAFIADDTSPVKSPVKSPPVYEHKPVRSGGISEMDISPKQQPVTQQPQVESLAKVAPVPEKPQASIASKQVTHAAVSQSAPTKVTKECTEALNERDLASEASESSDKLFHLRRALRLCPNSAPLHHELGRVYASMQRTKDAESEYKEALSLDPSFSAAKKELGALLKDEVQF